MTNNVKSYEFTAFLEEDLLSGSDGSLGCGDTFTMPASATVCFVVEDNDAFLSGDHTSNERATDKSYQTATVTTDDGGTTHVGEIYAEKYWVLKGSDGEEYRLIEIEQTNGDAEGKGDDYFTFYGDVPPAGVELLVSESCNVTSNWVDYKCLSAGLKWELDEDCVYTIEAEDLEATNFKTVHGDNASGDELVKITSNDGSLAANFGGEAGVYDIKIHAQDETDGASKIIVKVNGETVGTVMLDLQTDGRGSNDGHFSKFVLDGVEIGHGDRVELLAWKSGGEFVRIDKIEFEQVKDEPGTIRGRLTFDADCNDNEWNDFTGKWDAGVEGQVVQLVDLDGAVVAESTTTANGSYSFSVDPGEYRVKFPELENFEFSQQDSGVDDHFDSDADATGLTDVITVNSGQTIHNVDAGIKPVFVECDDPAAVKIDFEGLASGTVVSSQIAGVTIRAAENGEGNPDNDAMIFDSNVLSGGDSDLLTRDQGNILIVSEDDDSSDPDDAIGGKIYFDFDLPAKIFDIKIIDAEEGGFIDMFDADGNLLACVVIPNGVDGGIQQIILDQEDVSTLKVRLNGSGAVDDLCYVPGELQTAQLVGRYFCDENRNDVDDGESGIADVIIELLDATGAVVGQTKTASDGSYAFTGLSAGTYSVRFPAESTGKTFVAPNDPDSNGQGDDTDDSDVITVNSDGSGETGPIILEAGDISRDNDAGVADPLASISGRYFCDENGNALDDGEKGVANRTVTLDGAGADGMFGTADDVLLTTITASDGSYSFEDLEAGSYKVTIGGAAFVAKDVDGNVSDAIDSDVDQVTGMTDVFALGSGEDIVNVDAGTRCFVIPSEGRLDLGLDFDEVQAEVSPFVRFGFGSDATAEEGSTDYNATDQTLSLNADLDFTTFGDPAQFEFFVDPNAPTLQLEIGVDNDGDLVGGDAFDLIIFEDDNDDGIYDSGSEALLLSAQVIAFGSAPKNGTDNSFEVIGEVNGGEYAEFFNPLLGLGWFSTQDFDGSFQNDLDLDGKGFIGDIDADCICPADELIV